MKFKHSLLWVGLIICASSDICGQAIWEIKDPSGNDVFIDQDSSFLTTYNGHLLFYTINRSSGNRNILMTNGDTSFWVLSVDMPLESDYTPFIYRKNEELIFRIGDVWHSSYGSPETTQVFYDNSDSNNEYVYLKIFEFRSIGGFHNHLGIEALEKSSGDTLTLLHSYLDNTTVPYYVNFRVLQSGLNGVGPYEGKFFVGSIYDDLEDKWGEVGFYRQSSSDLTLLLPLGLKELYHVQNLYYSGLEWTVDYLDNGEKDVYDYVQSIDSCIEVTESEFPEYNLLEVLSPKWPAWGPLFPNYPPTSIEDLVWKGRNQNGSVRYFLRTLFGQEYEIEDLRNDNNVDFVFSHFHDDSIYYYNHSELQKGLVRTNFKNGLSVKESTSIPFDTNFILQSYNGKMYFGRYNSQSGTIQAISKDFVNGNKYEFLESTSGERIDNPINFNFIDDRIFIHSNTLDGVKLIVFDPDATVSVEPNIGQSNKIIVAPNPSNDVFQVHLTEDYLSTKDQKYVVYNDIGTIVKTGNVRSSLFEIDLSGFPLGTYYISISYKDNVNYSSPLILSGF